MSFQFAVPWQGQVDLGARQVSKNHTIRANSPIRDHLGPQGVEFLEFALTATDRLLPHTSIEWHEEAESCTTDAVWESNRCQGIKISIDVSDSSQSLTRSLHGTLRRRKTGRSFDKTNPSLERREHAICKALTNRLNGLLKKPSANGEQLSLAAIRAKFDEQVIASYLQGNHGIEIDMTQTLDALHKLAEMTYENKSISFGLIIDPLAREDGHPQVFPYPLLDQKKFRALSDGYHTCYHISRDGRLYDFVHLDNGSVSSRRAIDKNYPYWAEGISGRARDSVVAICLTRQGDILVFDEGMLRLSYRYGRWQYWNHAHLIKLIASLMRGNKASESRVSATARAAYQTALDVSFRRTGGLIVLLKNKNNLGSVYQVDANSAASEFEAEAHWQFDRALPTKSVTQLARPILAELAGLDGALILDRYGEILDFASVLRPKRTGRLKGSEGSRTKAAIGASHYGVAIKISSDGDITVFDQGAKIFAV
jgi:hypothetical protein